MKRWQRSRCRRGRCTTTAAGERHRFEEVGAWTLTHRLAHLLLEGLGGGEQGVVGEGAVATGPMSPPVSVTVTVDAAAEAELTRRGERIAVQFTVFDSRMDDGTYRDFDGTLGASGGTVSVPPLSTAPGGLGEVLSHWSVSVTSALTVFPDNLLRCTDASDEGDATAPPASITIECSLIRPPPAAP